MRYTAILLAGTVLGLTACGQAEVADDAAQSEPTEAAEESPPNPQPGAYSLSGELVEFEAPGAPPEEVEMARDFMSFMFEMPGTMCLTEEEAERGYRRFVEEMEEDDGSCKMTDYTTTSDSFSATVACNRENGESATMSYAGTVGDSSMNMTMTVDGTDPEIGKMRMVVRMNSERTGDCET